MGARIIAVADSFDAMTSDRAYRKAMSVEEACAELERCSGSQFDPLVVKAFIGSPLSVKPKPESHSEVLKTAFSLIGR